MDFFIRDTDSLIPVEVKANDNASASLNNLISSVSGPNSTVNDHYVCFG